MGTYPSPSLPTVLRTSGDVQQAGFVQLADLVKENASGAPLALADLTELTLARNPRLAQVTWAVETARGKALQAGLYPNPTVNLAADELNDRTGRGGILSLPHVTQEFVTAGKLKLARGAADREVDAATLAVVAERYRVLTDVRQAYFDVLTLERRAEALAALVELSDQAAKTTEKLVAAKVAAQFDVVQLELDRDRYRAELESAQKQVPAARRRLAATVGVAELPAGRLAGSLDVSPPNYDLAQLNSYMLEVNPQVRSAMVGVERARLLVQRAEADVVPNVSGTIGYTYQGQNR
ncbi:MAG: TolC family protein, partial [Gemmata sp.]